MEIIRRLIFVLFVIVSVVLLRELILDRQDLKELIAIFNWIIIALVAVPINFLDKRR